MAGSVNKVILVGNLGADPTIHYTSAGSPIASFRVATTDRWRDKQSGEQREKTEWHSVVIYNEHLVKVAEQRLQRGSKVYLEGELRTRKWQDQSGGDRWSTQIALTQYKGQLMGLAGLRQDSKEALQGQGGGRVPDTPGSPYNDPDDDIPFASPDVEALTRKQIGKLVV